VQFEYCFNYLCIKKTIQFQLDMLDKRQIEKVLTEQLDELEKLKNLGLCPRDEEAQVDFGSELAQVVIGVRRSGKSILCHNVLMKLGEKFAYADFDDERFLDMTSDDLDNVLEVLYKINGEFNVLFLDEIQNVEGWYLFVNRLLRKKMRVIITGSNAKLLSAELATHLTGRHEPITLYPFSFKEFCMYKNVDTNKLTTAAEGFRRAAFDEYLIQGGFPELMKVKNNTRYIGTLVDNILKRDIEKRYKIRFKLAFENLAQHLLNIAPAIIDYPELSKIIGIGSTHTTENYVKYLNEAFMIRLLHKYSAKSKQRIVDNKVYAVDVALMSEREDALVGDNLGWRLETLVYIELLRRNTPLEQDIFYYKKRPKTEEADFVVCKKNKVLQVIQVSYDISEDKTRKREINGLIAAAKGTKCDNLLLITDHERGDIEEQGYKIAIRPAYDWMLEK
jgi:uncharacterized protein